MKNKISKKNFFLDFWFFQTGGTLAGKKILEFFFFFEILFFKIHFWHFYQIFDFVIDPEIFCKLNQCCKLNQSVTGWFYRQNLHLAPFQNNRRFLVLLLQQRFPSNRTGSFERNFQLKYTFKNSPFHLFLQQYTLCVHISKATHEQHTLNGTSVPK